MDRRLIFYASALLVVLVLASWLSHAYAAAPSPDVKINPVEAKPRQIEGSTVQAVARDYSNGWKSLAAALEQNRPELLDANFTGIALERFRELISAQKKSGLHQKIVDRGHTLDLVFYSADGSAIQARDTAQLEIQFMDGGSVVRSEQLVQRNLVVLTPAENSWKVRVLEEVPAF